MLKKKRLIFALILILVTSNLFLATSKAAPLQSTQLELVEKYAPILYFHPDEIFRPQPVDVILGTSRLRENVNNWFDHNIINSVTLSDLVNYKDAEFFIDVWYGNRGESDYKNFTAHRNYYRENLSPDADGPPTSVYARVVQDETTHQIVLQYWLFYYYNDWFNKHEGDWELIQIILNPDQTPEWVVLSQHHGGTRRAWQTTQLEDGTHPLVYVALGSHANYFWGDEIYPNGMDIGNARVEILDRTGTAGKILPQVIPFSELDVPESPASENDWLAFLGNWGETAIQSDFGGPTGPSAKGEQWDSPNTWGLSQPLDIEAWYKNRLRIITENTSNEIIIPGETPPLTIKNIDAAENYFILHADPSQTESWTFTIEADFLPASNAHLFWPEAEGQIVTHYSFSGLGLNGTQQLTLHKPTGGVPQLVEESGFANLPADSAVNTQTWDQPDLVWFAGYLNAGQVVRGILLSLASGIIPTLAFIFLIYNFDKNEKEPKSLVAAALAWGAFPAVLVALAANLFFNLPPSLIGPEAIEAVKTGVFSPLIEELLKGAIVLFIATRRKNEFNNTLDGIIYGAMVGLGFAMTGNTISYIGSFLYRGFDSLRLSILIEGIFFGLNHAFYTAIFGAGLGYAKQLPKRHRNTLIPIGTFILAVIVNGLHSYVIQALVGVTPIIILLNWLGISVIYVIMVVSIRHENQILAEFLKDELPAPLYSIATNHKNRQAFQKKIRKTHGKQFSKLSRQYFKQVSQLAFHKSQLLKNPSDEIHNQLEFLRRKIQAANAQMISYLQNEAKTDG